MSFKGRFTQSGQALLATTPIVIGSAMVFAESSGLGTVKELFASAKTYIGGLLVAVIHSHPTAAGRLRFPLSRGGRISEAFERKRDLVSATVLGMSAR
jgi:hypothetical protein